MKIRVLASNEIIATNKLYRTYVRFLRNNRRQSFHNNLQEHVLNIALHAICRGKKRNV